VVVGLRREGGWSLLTDDDDDVEEGFWLKDEVDAVDGGIDGILDGMKEEEVLMVFPLGPDEDEGFEYGRGGGTGRETGCLKERE